MQEVDVRGCCRGGSARKGSCVTGDGDVAAAARERCDAWDDMHRFYFPDYDQRWQVAVKLIGRAVEGRALPRVLDLGCGPGTLTRRLSQVLPLTCVLGIDGDPLLVDMARALPGSALLSYRRARVGSASTVVLLQDLAPFDAIVSSAFVHYFDTGQLARLHALCRRLLAPDGLLVTVERFSDAGGGGGPAGEDPWSRWWVNTYAHPLFSGYVDRVEGRCRMSEPLPLPRWSYASLLREARFADVSSTVLPAGSAVVAARPCR